MCSDWHEYLYLVVYIYIMMFNPQRMRATLGVFSTCRRSGIGTVRTMSGVQLVDLGYGVASEYKQRSAKSLLPPHLRIGLTVGQLIS